MNKLMTMLLLLSILVVGNTAIHAEESASDAAITLERTGCRGTCPIYSITIFQDGSVRYDGKDFVTVIGQQTTELDAETVEQMVEAFVEVGYFEWDETYVMQTVSDLPSVITSVTRSGETQRIERYVGDSTAPLALPFLEQWIDEVTHSQMWTGVQPNPGAISNGTDTPLIAMQRRACFGMCPVYTISLFENGTGVYIGIANVDEFGVRIFETEPSAIIGIVLQAEGIGYFSWLDSYEERVITDQATVITSIRSADYEKRIVRYDGDPNAPIGLTWIERNIDQLIEGIAD